MRFKGHRHRLATQFSGSPHDVADDLPVGPMHAVKVAHTENGAPKVRGNLFEFVENLHLRTGRAAAYGGY